MELQAKNPQNIGPLFPLMLDCLAQVTERLVRAGVQVYKHRQGGSATDAREDSIAWRWRITSLDAEATSDYTTMHDALLAAIIYLVRNSNDPKAVLLGNS